MTVVTNVLAMCVAISEVDAPALIEALRLVLPGAKISHPNWAQAKPQT